MAETTVPALPAVWRRVDELVDRAPSVEDLLDHRLGAFAARLWRARGVPLAPAIEEEERYASVATLAVPVLLARVGAAYGHPALVLKGPEIAARYPQPTLRPSHDLDLLVEDSAAAFRALRDAGCDVVGTDPSDHHELPLAFPDLPLTIELHSTPKWPAWGSPPSVRELLGAATASLAGVDGAVALEPARHAVLTAVHSWAHRPLARVLDLVDVLVLLADGDPAEANRWARLWGVERIWRSTLAAAGAVFGDAPRPWTLRTWARNTPAVRRPTRVEELLERCLSPLAALPPDKAIGATRRAVTEMLDARSHAGGTKPRPTHPALVAARDRAEGDAGR